MVLTSRLLRWLKILQRSGAGAADGSGTLAKTMAGSGESRGTEKAGGGDFRVSMAWATETLSMETNDALSEQRLREIQKRNDGRERVARVCLTKRSDERCDVLDAEDKRVECPTSTTETVR